MAKTKTTEKVIKSIPSTETVWVKQLSGDKAFYITSNNLRETYNLYLEVEEGFIKVSSAKNPLDFDDVIKKYK